MGPYWSLVECLGRPELEELQKRRLRSLLSYLVAASDHYRDTFRRLGIEPDEFRLADLQRLPLTAKEDLTRDVNPALPGGYATFWVGDWREILRWHRTSGTTGTPIWVGDTAWDWNAYAELSAEALFALGVRESDLAVAAFSYGPFIALWSYMAGLERIGAALVPCGGMDAHARVRLLQEFRATVLLTTPSYAAHMAEVARVGLGLDPRRDLHLRLVVVTGEPCPPSLKRKLKDLWGIPVYDRLGCAEVGGIAYECPASAGTYHVQEGFLVAEVLDPASLTPVRAGEDGELVLTPLYRRGMPLLRFRTGNIVRLAGSGRCRCGRELLSLAETENGVVLRRTDALVKVRGVLVDPEQVVGTVHRCCEFGGAVQVVIEREGEFDQVTVLVESTRTLSPQEMQHLAERLEIELRSATGVRMRVRILPLGTIQARGDKIQRVVDRRGAEANRGEGADHA